MSYNEVISFWFDELDSKKWWAKDPELDEEIAKRFGAVHGKASVCELFSWRKEPLGRLAEIIVLDQFSRNIYRDKAQAFQYDSQALALAQEAVFLKVDQEVDKRKRPFFYMPYMHSESLIIHNEALKLFSAFPEVLDFEMQHKKIIESFGRYPHRNKTLLRVSTKAELEFLKQDNSSF